MSQPIFVFGSNLEGRHGKGAALFAKRFRGAKQGQGIGLQGQSYAIPTCSKPGKPLPLGVIEIHINGFLQFAKDHPELTFELTPIGCGLAGYRPQEIAPMFKGVTKNVQIPLKFKGLI